MYIIHEQVLSPTKSSISHHRPYLRLFSEVIKLSLSSVELRAETELENSNSLFLFCVLTRGALIQEER